MAFEFKFPDVGEGITEGTLVEWKVDKGSKVKVDQSVASVETDKAVVDIPCPTSGTVIELLGQKGDTLNVGDVIMKIETEQGDNDSSEASQQQDISTKEVEETQNQSTQEDKSEQTIDDDTTPSKSSNLLAMPGVVHEAKKRGIDLKKIKPSGKHGQITFEDLDQQEGENSSTNESSKETETTGETQTQKTASSSTDTDSQSQESGSQSQESGSQSQDQSQVNEVSQDLVTTLAVKKLARELDVDINFVVGTGENGRITAGDVKRAKESKDKLKSGENKPQDTLSSLDTQSQEEKDSEKTSQTQSQQVTQETPQTSSTETDSRTIKLEGVRKVIASKMVESLSKAAQVTISDEVEVSKLVEIREKEKEKLKEENVKLSYIPFIVKAVKHASKKYPHFNGRFNDEKQQLELFEDINMGVAVDTQKGLMVPVIKKAQELSIVDVAKSIMDLADKAKNSKLSQDEMKNSTFTISSIGSITGQTFTPILNYPEPAILGVGRIVEKPVCRDGEIVPGKTMTLSLTVDHRVIDGADAARFLKDVMNLLQDPELLLMEG